MFLPVVLPVLLDLLTLAWKVASVAVNEAKRSSSDNEPSSLQLSAKDQWWYTACLLVAGVHSCCSAIVFYAALTNVQAVLKTSAWPSSRTAYRGELLASFSFARGPVVERKHKKVTGVKWIGVAGTFTSVNAQSERLGVKD
jgi:hypothetical protein